MDRDPTSQRSAAEERKPGEPQTEGMGFGLAVLALIAVTCGVIIWTSVYL